MLVIRNYFESKVFMQVDGEEYQAIHKGVQKDGAEHLVEVLSDPPQTVTISARKAYLMFVWAAQPAVSLGEWCKFRGEIEGREINENTARDWARNSVISAYRSGRDWLVDPSCPPPEPRRQKAKKS